MPMRSASPGRGRLVKLQTIGRIWLRGVFEPVGFKQKIEGPCHQFAYGHTACRSQAFDCRNLFGLEEAGNLVLVAARRLGA